MDIVIVLTTRLHKCVVLERTDGLMTFPSGKVEDGEAPIAAAQREVFEETGLRVVRCFPIGSVTENGQTKHYFFAPDAEGILANKEPEKHRSVRWCNIDQVLRSMKLSDVVTHFLNTTYLHYCTSYKEIMRNGATTFEPLRPATELEREIRDAAAKNGFNWVSPVRGL